MAGGSPALIELAAAETVRCLCVFLVLQAVVSYRSVPAILRLFHDPASGAQVWQPHFTSVINWVLRLGLGLLNQVKPLAVPWIAIIDHSIDIGTKKALVVLRVRLDQLSGALQRRDCECIGLHVSETVNGESIRDALTPIFKQAGCPVGIINDGDATLNKGVRLWQQQQTVPVENIEDISHVVANALKKHYQHDERYQAFVSWSSQVAKQLRQTTDAFLIPPKLRKKGRFMSIGHLAKWGRKVADSLDQLRAEASTRLAGLLAGIEPHLPFIQDFADTARSVSGLMQLLKQQGLTTDTVNGCRQLVDKLPHLKLQATLNNWLDKHQGIQQRLGVDALPVSSDVIESLFGSFKHIMNRNPQADMNRSVLLIPALCGSAHLDEARVTTLLAHTPHALLQAWEKENIPYTLRKKRQAIWPLKKLKIGET